MQRGQGDVCGAGEISLSVGGGAVLALFDVVDGLGRGDPALGVDVVNGGLDALGVVFREEAKVLACDFDFGPDTMIEHREDPDGMTECHFSMAVSKESR